MNKPFLHFFIFFTFFVLLLFKSLPTQAAVVNYTDANSILSLTVKNNTLWAGTNGGLVKWNLNDLSYEKIGTDGKLPHMKVTSIAFDKKGNTWIGTHMGIVRYNGKKWRLYSIKNGLPSVWINHVFVDNDDKTWVSTRNGTSWFNGFYWETEKNIPVKMKQVYSMGQDKNNNYWYATNGAGIIRSNGKNWKAFESANNVPSLFLRSVTVDQNGTKWFGTYRGIISYKEGVWKRFKTSDGLSRIAQANYVFTDSKNRIWAGTTDGVNYFSDEKWHVLDPEGLIDNYVMAIAEDKKGNIYIGSKKGITQYDGKNFKNLVIENELPGGHHVKSTAIDNKNNLWLVLGEKGGAASFNGRSWKYYSEKEGLNNLNLSCVSPAKDGSIWFGGYNGISIYKEEQWTYLKAPKNMLTNTISIVHDKDGSVWIGTGRGVVHYQDKKFKTFDVEEGLPHSTVFSILPLKDFIWIGTHNGVLKVSRDWKQKEVVEQLKDLHISDIKKGKNGDFWFATMNGVYQFDGKNWKRYGFFDGLADNRVYSIEVEKNGTLWFSTMGGITRYNDFGFTSYSKGSGLADEKSTDITVDQNGIKWVSTALGLSRMDNRMEFSNMSYTGLGAKASITIEDSSLNVDNDVKEKIKVTVKNGILNINEQFIFSETGPDTALFMPSSPFTFSSDIISKKSNYSIKVKQGYTNSLTATYTHPLKKETITAKAFWEDVVTKGNLNGDGFVDRTDAAIARKVNRGYLKEFPLLPGADVNGDGKIGVEEEEYAIKVNTGKINPHGEEEGHSNAPGQKNEQINVKEFKPQELPWDVWKITEEGGGKIELDTLTMIIPPLALEKDTIIEIFQGERVPSPKTPEILPVGKGYNFHPVELYFEKPVTVILKYSEDDLRKWGIQDESSLKLGKWNKDHYMPITSSKVNIAAKEVTGTIDYFPDLLNRPNRQPFAPMRTVPISTLQTHSNYFTILAVNKGENLSVSDTHAMLIDHIEVVPAIQVIPPPETRQYYALAINESGHLINSFSPNWVIDETEGKGSITPTGLFQSEKDGITFINSTVGGKTKKIFTALGTCTWCHYFGKRCNCGKLCKLPMLK